MSTLTEFLTALALTIALTIAGHSAYMGQHGANFMPGVVLDTSQVIDATEGHGLLTL